MKNNHGGARPGSGRPKGRKGLALLTKEAIRAHVQQRVSAELDPLLDAQIANAKGLKYLVTRDKKTGKFIRVTEAMARLKQDVVAENEEIVEVWEKDPSQPAFTDLLNRAADRPVEAVQLAVSGKLEIEWKSSE